MNLNDIHSRVIRTSSWTLLALATISGYMSYQGALALAHDVIISVCYAVGVGGVIYLLATINIAIIPSLSQHNRRGLGWMAFIISILIAIAISSYTNLAGIAGKAVMTLDARHHVESVQVVISQTSLSAQLLQSTVTSLHAEHSRFLALKNEEMTSGTLSGGKGLGVITSVYIQAANVVDTAANALSSKKDDLDRIILQANDFLHQMRSVLDEDTEIEVKILKVAALNRKLQSAYEALAATNLQQLIENSLASLDSVIAVSSSKSVTFRKTQTKIIESIREDLALTKERYVKANSTSTKHIPEYPVWKPRFQTRLLLAYALDIIPYIVAAVSIDCAVFVVVLLLISLQREINENNAENVIEGRKISVRELNETLALLNSLRSSDSDEDVL